MEDYKKTITEYLNNEKNNHPCSIFSLKLNKIYNHNEYTGLNTAHILIADSHLSVWTGKTKFEEME